MLQALVNAQEEEENLTSELEKEQAAALEAANEEEQSYLKAIEREESTEIIVEEEETESLAVITIIFNQCEDIMNHEAITNELDSPPSKCF